MKNVDVKKLLVFIIIVALLVLAVLGLGKLLGKGGKPSKDVQKEVDTLTTKYFTSITYGYATEFDGTDVLFSKDKTTYDDLNAAAIVNVAIRYAEDNGIDISVTDAQQKILKAHYGEEAPAYKGEGVRKAVKILFDKDLAKAKAEGLLNYKYDYLYDADTDTYSQFKNKNYSSGIRNESINVETKILETTTKGDNLYVTLIAAYVLSQEGTRIYYSDPAGLNDSRVGETKEDDFLPNKDDSFQKYTMTLKKTSDGYAFESIEKVK